MNIDELNAWISSDEGKAWADALKAPLLAKRDELLISLREANGRVAQVASRATDAEKLLAEERVAVERTVVDGELTRILKDKRVMEPVIPGVIAELKQAYGLAVHADGADRRALGKLKDEAGNVKDVDLSAIYAAWSQTAAAREVTLDAGGSGGAAPGSGGHNQPPAPPRLSSLSGRALASMSDEDFQTALNQAR